MENLFGERYARREAHDDLERFYTPEKLASACVRLLVDEMDGVPPVAVEPSAGGGAFVRALRAAGVEAITGIDVDEHAAGLELCDRSLVMDVLRMHAGVWGDTSDVRAVVGNPPFGDASEHIPILREVFPMAWLGFILPIENQTVGYWQPVLSELAGIAPIVGRPWPVVRGVAFYVWGPLVMGPPTRCKRYAPISGWK